MNDILGQADREIGSIQNALSRIPGDHLNIALLLVKLANALEQKFYSSGQPNDIDKAVKSASIAVTITPHDSLDLPVVFHTLGRVHCSRFQYLGDLGDIEKAIEYQTRALAAASENSPNLGGYLASLAIPHKIRFENLGQLADLEKAIEYENRALTVAPGDPTHISGQLNNLGLSYQLRFQRLGELVDLEKAIEVQATALTFVPEDHPDFIMALSSLGVSRKIRYEHLGEFADLEKAIEHESRALALTTEGQPYMQTRLANLGVSYFYRFKRLEKQADFERAIEYQSRAIAVTPQGHPYLFSRLQNLGGFYAHQFSRLQELTHLEKAIEYMSKALVSAPEGHPNLPPMLFVLGELQKARFQRPREPDDIKQAFRNMHRGLSLFPEGHPTLPVKYNIFADCHLFIFQLTGDTSFLEDSLELFRVSSRSLSGAPRVIFENAYRWASAASEQNALNPIEAYQTAINLLPQFIWLGATTTQRYEDLKKTETVAIEAAFVAIRASDYELALEWLEHARCVVWNQSLMLRSPLDRLHSVDPDLSSRLQQVADQLHDAGSKSQDNRMPPSSSDSLTEELVAQKHRRLAKEYNDLLSQARELPGLEDFLQPMKAKSLIHAARNGPVVVINCHKDRCDALIILPGVDCVDHVALPKCTGEKAQRARFKIETSLRRKGIRERGVKYANEPELKDIFRKVLADLWYDIVQPVLEHLGYITDVSTEKLPHITWCPTGALSFLPLHAAGDYDRPRSRVFDYTISSYTPTLTALLASTAKSLDSNRELRILTVGQANTQGHSPLPGTTREVGYVKAHAHGKAEYMVLIDSHATTINVLDAMETHDWVHFACHAHQNVADPTKSGFFLHDATLDLASINSRSFKNKGLAFLSACQTATGDEALPDEAIHLASGMLMAGYPSVIATMWSVRDEIAPFVADKVYERLLKDGKVGGEEVGKGLHYAIGELREKVGENKFAYWVPYIHIGS